MGSKRVGLARTQALIEGLKRELAMGGTTFTNVVQQGTSTSTAGSGAQSGSITAPVTRVTEVNGEIMTTITVDIQNLSASAGAVKTVIGNAEAADDGTAPAKLITWDTDSNGIMYKAEMICIEAPAGNGGGNALDIDLAVGSSAANEQGATTDGAILVSPGGAWVINTMSSSVAATCPDTHALYLTNGNTVGATGDAQYTAGKFIINLYGHKDF